GRSPAPAAGHSSSTPPGRPTAPSKLSLRFSTSSRTPSNYSPAAGPTEDSASIDPTAAALYRKVAANEAHMTADSGSAEFLGEPDKNAFRPADVAEPVR